MKNYIGKLTNVIHINRYKFMNNQTINKVID